MQNVTEITRAVLMATFQQALFELVVDIMAARGRLAMTERSDALKRAAEAASHLDGDCVSFVPSLDRIASH